MTGRFRREKLRGMEGGGGGVSVKSAQAVYSPFVSFRRCIKKSTFLNKLEKKFNEKIEIYVDFALAM